MQIEIVNKLTETAAETLEHNAYTVDIDRPSPLGNPFPMKSEKDRDEVITKFRAWLAENTATPRVRREIARIRGLHAKHGKVRLRCWCHPKPCHGDIIAKYLETGES